MTGLHRGGHRFLYKIKPHKVMKEEYPSLYYKFRNQKVAFAFLIESFGREIEKPPLGVVFA